MSTHKNHANTAEKNHDMSVADGGLLRGSAALAIISLIGFGFLYPLASVGLSQVLLNGPASGSLIERNGQVVGSRLVAQPFLDDRYFYSRPSAADYNPMEVGGSNQARTNPALRQRVEEARTAIVQQTGLTPAEVPSDLITQSGSGIDPHISPQAAAIQISRVASARGIAPEIVEAMVAQHTQGKQFGLLGQPHVNVLELNLAMDESDFQTVTTQ
ncbi:MAG: potassium-transporting ATPase subunit KdpC [Pseudohongiella sp.]|nr:potassium-transporting ATPase subunit KdpC [Pseudohongiella sp.]